MNEGWPRVLALLRLAFGLKLDDGGAEYPREKRKSQRIRACQEAHKTRRLLREIDNERLVPKHWTGLDSVSGQQGERRKRREGRSFEPRAQARQGVGGLDEFGSGALESLQAPHHHPTCRISPRQQKRLKRQKSNFAEMPGGGQITWADACGKIGHIAH